MQRRAKVELFEQIQREYHFGDGTISGVARKLGVHRRMVRQALQSAIPPTRKRPQRQRFQLGPVQEFIDEILRADQNAPRKQRHTSHCIWVRLQQEKDASVAESTVRQYVRERKVELGLAKRETCVPQSYGPGQEAQVDWCEAVAELAGERHLVQVFAMRSMWSGAALCGAGWPFIVPFDMPPSRRSWRLTSEPLLTSAVSFLACATIT
jgi:transposase-like protein